MEIWAGEHGVCFAAAQSAVRAFVDVVILSECPLLFERAVFLTAIIKLYKRGPPVHRVKQLIVVATSHREQPRAAPD